MGQYRSARRLRHHNNPTARTATLNCAFMQDPRKGSNRRLRMRDDMSFANASSPRSPPAATVAPRNLLVHTFVYYSTFDPANPKDHLHALVASCSGSRVEYRSSMLPAATNTTSSAAHCSRFIIARLPGSVFSFSQLDLPVLQPQALHLFLLHLLLLFFLALGLSIELPVCTCRFLFSA